MPVARRVRLVLQRTPARAGRGLGLGGGGHLGRGRRHGRLLGLDLAAHGLQLGLDIGEAVLAGQTAGRTGRRIDGDREAVPAPEVALARHQALAGLEHRCEARGLFALDHSDLRQASSQLFRRLDVIAERLHAIRQRRIGGIDGGAGPAHGRGRIDRGFEIIAERGTEGSLVTLVDGDAIERRRP